MASACTSCTMYYGMNTYFYFFNIITYYNTFHNHAFVRHNVSSFINLLIYCLGSEFCVLILCVFKSEFRIRFLFRLFFLFFSTVSSFIVFSFYECSYFYLFFFFFFVSFLIRFSSFHLQWAAHTKSQH